MALWGGRRCWLSWQEWWNLESKATLPNAQPESSSSAPPQQNAPKSPECLQENMGSSTSAPENSSPIKSPRKQKSEEYAWNNSMQESSVPIYLKPIYNLSLKQTMILSLDWSITEWIRRTAWCKGSCSTGSQRPWIRWIWSIRWRSSRVVWWCLSWVMRRWRRGLNRGKSIQWLGIYTKQTVTTVKHRKFSTVSNHSPTHIPKRSNKGILSQNHFIKIKRLNRWLDLLEEIEVSFSK